MGGIREGRCVVEVEVEEENVEREEAVLEGKNKKVLGWEKVGVAELT